MTELRIDGPGNKHLKLALAHGAGAGMDEPLLAYTTQRLVQHKLRVVRFEFPYMAARRQDGKRRPPDRLPVLRETWLHVISSLGTHGLVIGGKSMGGRIASLVADEVGVEGLVCLGYPFHPPGKPQQLRIAHLKQIETPTLILQGTRDPFGGYDEVAEYPLSPNVRIHWIDDGDHSLKPRASSGRTAEQNWEEAAEVIVDFMRDLVETE